MDELQKKPYERIIFVCCNQKDPGEASCANRGSGEFQKQLKEYMKSRGIKGLRVSRSLCLGLCEQGPNICVMPENVWYRASPRRISTRSKRSGSTRWRASRADGPGPENPKSQRTPKPQLPTKGPSKTQGTGGEQEESRGEILLGIAPDLSLAS